MDQLHNLGHDRDPFVVYLQRVTSLAFLRYVISITQNPCFFQHSDAVCRGGITDNATPPLFPRGLALANKPSSSSFPSLDQGWQTYSHSWLLTRVLRRDQIHVTDLFDESLDWETISRDLFARALTVANSGWNRCN